MRHRLEPGLSDRATIKRYEQVGTENREPVHELTTVAEDVPCQFDSASTSYVREDSGERVNRPASVTFAHDIDIEEGDTVLIGGVETSYEVRGLDPERHHRHGTIVSIEAELERAD